MNLGLIITTCNRPKLLERAIASALIQTPAFSEIIVVNDGEEDVSPKGVRIIKTKGYEGLPRARNIGLMNMSSDIDAFCYLDDDDELLSSYTAVQSELIQSGNDFGFSIAKYRFKDGETTDPEPTNQGPKKYYDPNALLEQNIAPVSSYVHSRKALEAVGQWDDTILKIEDWDFWGRMFIAMGPPKKSEEITNLIHKDGGPTMSSGNPFAYSAACSWRDIVERRLHYLKEKGQSTLDGLEQFHIPSVSIPKIEDAPQWTIKDAETVRVYRDPNVQTLAYSPRGLVCPASLNDVAMMNSALLLCRCKYIALSIYEVNTLKNLLGFLQHDKTFSLVGSPTSFLMDRKVIETLGGLNEEMTLEEAIADLWERAKIRFASKLR